MNWQYLRYFEIVAKEEHYTHAAEKLHITQSALSKSIDNLESELGVPLFERYGRNIKLTKYGQIFSNYVIHATQEIEKGVKTIQGMANVASGTVIFSSVFTLGANFIPDILKKYSEENPNVKLVYYQKSTTDILEDVLNREIDFGFCGEFIREGAFSTIESEPILVEELVLAVPRGHILAGREKVEMNEILDEQFIGYTDNTGIIHSIAETMRQAGIKKELHYAYLAAEDNTMAGMVRAGLGIAFIANNQTIYTKDISLLHITNPFFTRTLYMVWKKDSYLSPAARAFKYFVLTNSHA